MLALLALATLAVGRQSIFYQINAVLIIAGLTMLVLISMSRRSLNRDAVVIRRGLLIFAAFIFWENFRSLLGFPLPNIEPIGFVAFLRLSDMSLRARLCNGTSNSARFKRNLR